MLRHCVVGLLCAMAAACGPVQSTAYLLDAEVQIQAARTAGAEKLAPYEWTAANLYLEKAREEVGYSDYEVAVRFAEQAAKQAAEARRKAMAAKGDTSTASELP